MSMREILIYELDYTPEEADAIIAEIHEDPDAVDNY